MKHSTFFPAIFYRLVLILVLLTLLALPSTRLAAAASGNIEWIHQFGGLEPGNVIAEVADADGNVYVAGTTNGMFPGQTTAGGFDAFVRKYDANGNEVWTRQFGSSSSDSARGIVVDVSGVYVTGETYGALPGQTSSGNGDVFVRKYDVDGSEVWTRQFGSSGSDTARGIAVDASGVYVTGETYGALPGQTSSGNGDVFVRKYDADGSEVWTRQFGSSAADLGFGITVDASGVYVTGETYGALPGQIRAGGVDAFVRKYDAAGNEVWTRQFGSSTSDSARGIAVNASGVYVTGQAGGALPGQSHAGGYDVFIRKYDANGSEVWTRQFGTSAPDSARGIAVDASGVYITGDTSGTLPGQTNAGGYDMFVRKYDADGSEVWTRQFGSSNPDTAHGIAVDASEVYVTGQAGGALPGQIGSGGGDSFVRKYDADGSEVWTRQFGVLKPAADLANSVDVDGNVYVAGVTYGALPGQISAGDIDAFVRKYDTSGNEIWTRQFGTASYDHADSLAVDPSGVYVAGFMGEYPFVRKYDADGNELWTRQLNGSFSSDMALKIAVDASGVYLSTGVNPGNWVLDIFVRKYDVDGNELWTRQFGTSNEEQIYGVSADASGVYLAGYTSGGLPGQVSAGQSDVFVRKYDADGNEAWTRQFGSVASEWANAIAVDASGVYTSGLTYGALPGQTSSGHADVFVRKYDADGNEVWTHQFGTSSPDGALGIAVDVSGVYVTGYTDGALPGQTNAGGHDIFVRQYDAGGAEVWTRQFGTPAPDLAFGVAVDASGVYVTGRTDGIFPGQTSVGEVDAFVVKLMIGNTPSGSNVTVSPGSGTTLVFADVSSGGQTTVTTGISAPPLPAGFSLGTPPTFYDISTTATYSPPVTVCIAYDPAQYGDPADLHLLHYENEGWADATTSNDTTNYVICGLVDSLSPFVVARRVYDFSGFFQPVDNLPTFNVVKAGSAMPVKFRLGGDQGLSIFDLGYPLSRQIACDRAAPMDNIEQTLSAGDSGLQYDATTDTYTYVWKTQKSWAGTCRQLIIRLDDGTEHVANFQFRP